MLRAVVADLHLGQVPGDLERFHGAVSRLIHRGVGEVTFLGDVFLTLVGFRRFWDAPVLAGLEELSRLRDRAVRVVVVEGNRDFFLDSAALRPFLDGWGMAHSFTAGGRRFLLEHGDLINRRDRMYRLWRGISKSRAARLWARLLPRRLAWHVVHRTERQLAKTNFSYRRELPVADLEAAARRHFAAGVDVVMWGHFHRRWRLAVEGREALVAPPWCEDGEMILIDSDGSITADEGPSH